MGFIQWIKDRSSSQPSLLPGEDSEIITADDEPTRKTVNRALRDEIKRRNPSPRTYAEVNETVCQETLGQTTEQMAAQFGGKKGDRSKWPTEAKLGVMVGDQGAKNQIQEDDARGHSQIVDSARQGARSARRLFPW